MHFERRSRITGPARGHNGPAHLAFPIAARGIDPALPRTGHQASTRYSWSTAELSYKFLLGWDCGGSDGGTFDS